MSKLKTAIKVNTEITGELTHQDLTDIAKTYGLVPPDWDHYSVEIVGKGASGGAKLILRNTFMGKTAPTVIQWLGTNCGRSFLRQASRRMGREQEPFMKRP